MKTRDGRKSSLNSPGRAGAFLALYCTLLSPPTPAAPRTVVEQISTLIENNYFDATQAQSIAKDLRDANHAGRFDALTDPRDLAASLTEIGRAHV